MTILYFFEDLINKDQSYLLSNEQVKIKAKCLRLKLLNFFNLSSVRYSLEYNSNLEGLTDSIYDSVKVKFTQKLFNRKITKGEQAIYNRLTQRSF